MEKFELPKKEEIGEKKIIKQDIVLPDGKIFEAHYDAKNKLMERFFIKDVEGKLWEFTELKNIDLTTPEKIRQVFFDKGIALKKEEVEKIMLKLIKGKLDEMIDEIDENKNIEN